LYATGGVRSPGEKDGKETKGLNDQGRQGKFFRFEKGP